MMSHVIETYFHVETNTPVQDQLAESLLRVCVETGPKLMAEPENYEYRETIMYCGTMALNGVLQMGAAVTGEHITWSMLFQLCMIYPTPEDSLFYFQTGLSRPLKKR